jgi:hypothetical protein
MKKHRLKECAMIPVATGISSGGDRKEILYGCAKCGASFRTMGNKQTHCHGCEALIEWEYVKTQLPESFCGSTEDERAILDHLNQKQLFGELV